MMKAEQKTSSMKYCTNCALPATFPGIHFNDKGICNYCLDFKGIEFEKAKKAEYHQKFDSLIKAYKGQSSYDVLMCYSGGKDSTYTLAILKEKYDLNILALSFDNGFLPDQTLTNIRNVVEILGVDHILMKPRFDILAKIFRYCAEKEVYPLKALERSSAICTSCMAIIKYSALRLALEKEIPFIAWGWSPGQAPIPSSIMKNIPSMINKMQKTLYDPIFKITGDEINPYFLADKFFSGSYRFPYNINPLAFLDYNIEAIYKNISRFGWKKPEEVDANSTNCLLNSYANFVHKKQMGFHPYAFELAKLVREGNLDRATALQRLEENEDPHIIALVRDKLVKG
jgi:hypothetical protein